MATERTQKEQFNVKMPPAVIAHVKRRHLEKGWSQPVQALAGLVAFECLSEQRRMEFIQMAVRLRERELTWDQLLTHIEDFRSELPEERILIRLTQRLLKRLDEGE